MLYLVLFITWEQFHFFQNKTMFHQTLVLFIVLCSLYNIFSTNKVKTMNKLSSENLFCATCSYEYTFAELQNWSTFERRWSACENQTVAKSTFAAKTCHTLVRVDYTHEKVIFYHNFSYLALKKPDINKHRVVTATIMSTNQTRV